MPLDPKRVQAVFLSVVECDGPSAREAVLDDECMNDSALRQRVEALLRAHDRPNSILEKPVVGRARNGASPDAQPVGGGRDADGIESFISGCAWTNPTIDSQPDPRSKTIVRRPTGEVARRDLPVVAGYEILDELGRGGMGIVYKARQVMLDRPCALKMILDGAHASPEAAARFLAEAQAIARLQHPHIVQIRHIDESAGLPFFELEYLDGGSLDRRLDGTPWPARRAAELLEILSRAVTEAHRVGIVHRDLKPANILLAVDGTPKIADFGLAKSLTADSGLTATDSIIGSPGYMAPEQAEGKTKQIGPLSDVYALGAILYELLTGRPPFRSASVLETLEQVKAAEPVPPSRLVTHLPRDIETIALKCLQKEPGKRYQSAALLAEDLRRFLEGKSIVARPVTPWERSWRWCRRHPAPAALTAAIVLVAALGLAGMLWGWGEAVIARDLEAKARQAIETILVDMYTTNGVQAGDQGDHVRAVLWFANAARRARSDPDRRLANTIRAGTWGRQALAPQRAVVADGSWPAGLVFHPRGRHLIAKSVIDGQTLATRNALWDLETERPVLFPGGFRDVPAATWSPDGDSLAVGTLEGDVVVTRFPGGEEPTHIRFPGPIRALKYSSDGRWLAMAGGNSARVWDVRSRQFATPELVHPAAVSTLAFHPDGRFLATGCKDNQARLFAVPALTGEPHWPAVPHMQNGSRGVWDPWFCSSPLFVDGARSVMTCGGKQEFNWRAVETGVVTRTVNSGDLLERLAAAELSPDGRYIAVFGSQRTRVRLIAPATGHSVGPAMDHMNTVLSAAFSPDGRMLATGSTDGMARLWGVPGGNLLARPLDLHRTVHLVAFAPDGQSIATQDSELVRLWKLPREASWCARLPLDGNNSLAELSPDGALAIPTGMSFSRSMRTTTAYSIATGQPAGPALRPRGVMVDAAFSPDGQSVATLSTCDSQFAEGQAIVVWDWSSGRRRWQAPLPCEPRSLSYRPDGRRLAALCSGGDILVFDTDNGHETLRWQAHDADHVAAHWINNGKVRYSPDGRSLLTWGLGNDVRVWDADVGRLRYPPLSHRDKCHDVAFSPGGQFMALASYDGSVRVRELATGVVLTELPAHRISFTPPDSARTGRCWSPPVAIAP